MRAGPMSEAFARRYKLQERIAVGGTAEVFHALFFADDGDERPVVIKRVLPQFARDERFRRLFLEEACVAVTVTHPNIVRVLDHGELEQTCYIALERVDGMDLGSLLRRARSSSDRLPEADLAAFVVAQVGKALQFIHDQTSSEGLPLKIIHRDVSPQNILVSYSGDVKLTDFGIAKSAIRQETTVDGTLRGKLDYMAPEQASLGEVDHRADLFALGCVLYELIAGVPPFRGENELETLDRIRNHRLRVPPEELDAPEPLRQVLLRALAPVREERYQRAAEMVEDLGALMADRPADELRQALGAWARELAEQAPVKPDAVDHAVRQLLGESIDTAAPTKGTTVFASSSGTIPVSQTAEVEAPPPRLRRLSVALVAVAAVGICGWLLWAVLYFGATPEARDGGLAVLLDLAPSVRPEASPADGPRRAPARKLALRSYPPGAGVIVDGKPAGQTPMELPLPDHPFTLELRKPGYRSWSRRMDPKAAPASLRAVLYPAGSRVGSGWLTINSLPWSRVKIDGTYVGNTPLIRMQLSAGKHRVEILAPDGRVRKRFTVVVRSGETKPFTFDFTKGP
jgi:serine/threonine protein kinase